MPTVLTVAGSDSGGGAGIQADLKAIQANGAFGCSAVVALTAQNTRGVQAVHAPPLAFVEAQLESVLSDIAVDAIKTGMLPSADVIAAVAARADRAARAPRALAALVVDPVLVASSGDRLVDDAALAATRALLVPRATVLTPNLPEAAALLGEDVAALDSVAAMACAARALFKLAGPASAVLLKGGHRANARDATRADVLRADAEDDDEVRRARNARGTRAERAVPLRLGSRILRVRASRPRARRAPPLSRLRWSTSSSTRRTPTASRSRPRACARATRTARAARSRRRSPRGSRSRRARARRATRSPRAATRARTCVARSSRACPSPSAAARTAR